MKFENAIQNARFGYMLLQKTDHPQNDWLIIEYNSNFASLSGLSEQKPPLQSLNAVAYKETSTLFNWQLLQLYLSPGQQYITYVQTRQDVIGNLSHKH